MLGVDVGKGELYGTWRDGRTRQIRWQGAVPNTRAGIERLLRRVPAVALVVEPTGRYGEPLIRAAQAAGREVVLATTRRAKAFLWAEQPRAKTDRVDSAGLALYGLGGRLRPYVLPSVGVDRVRQLLAARRGLSQSLSSLRLQQASLPLAAAALEPAIAALAQQLAAIDAQIKECIAATPDLAPVVARLQAIPGIGPVPSAALAACLAHKQFDSADQFVAYVGLDIRVRRSGKRAGHLGLSKHGDAELRRLLFLAARAASTSVHDRTLADRYQREQAKGLSKTAAANAVARKLAKLAWSIVTHGSTYDPARVDSQPTQLDTKA